MTRLVIFDVDSTLLQVESLDFAVARALKTAPDGAERAQRLSTITDQGMSGALDFRQSLEQRIAIAGLTGTHIMPASVALAGLITPGMDALIEALRSRGDGVFAVSGGFLELLGPALATLGFMPGDVRANRFMFDDAGAVTGFDRDNPLSRSGGKAVVVRALKAEAGAAHAVMVGDGMTDYEAYAAGAADAFIGFGGVVQRAPVRENAPAWAGDVDALAKLLGV